jgi:hypothetical protein
VLSTSFESRMLVISGTILAQSRYPDRFRKSAQHCRQGIATSVAREP